MADLVPLPPNFGQIQQSAVNPTMNFRDFIAAYTFTFQATGNVDADATDTIAIVATNEFLTQAIISQYFTGLPLKKFLLTQRPIDPAIVYTPLGIQANQLAAQLSLLYEGNGGLSKQAIKMRIRTNISTGFGDSTLAFYTISGNTVLRNFYPLDGFIIATDQQNTIADFLVPMDFSDYIGFSLQPRNGPVGAIETLSTIMMIANNV